MMDIYFFFLIQNKRKGYGGKGQNPDQASKFRAFTIKTYIYIYLTLYHAIPTFNRLEEEAYLQNIVGKGENAGLPAFSPFPTMFSILFRKRFDFSVVFDFLP